jgi:hypothetical protein
VAGPAHWLTQVDGSILFSQWPNLRATTGKCPVSETRRALPATAPGKTAPVFPQHSPSTAGTTARTSVPGLKGVLPGGGGRGSSACMHKSGLRRAGLARDQDRYQRQLGRLDVIDPFESGTFAPR